MDQNELIQIFSEKGLHWGGRRSFIHPKMKKFVFTYKGDLAVINLQKSAELWEKTFNVLTDLISQGKTILFVATQPAAEPVVRKYGQELGFPYITTRWLGGTITNFETFKKRLEYLKGQEAKMASPDFEKYTKKERGLIQKEAQEIRRKFDGLVKIAAFPDAIFVFCGKKHRTALSEAKRKNIKVLGIFGLEDNPDEATEFVPLNDNVRLGVEFVMEKVAEIYLKHQPKKESPVQADATAVSEKSIKEVAVKKETEKSAIDRAVKKPAGKAVKEVVKE